MGIYKHKHFGHTPMGHMLQHVATSKCIFLLLSMNALDYFWNFLEIYCIFGWKGIWKQKEKKILKGIKVNLCVWSMCTHSYDVTYNYK
jgi:hypothetical protein